MQAKLSREEIRAVYAQGEEAVIALVEGLLKRIEALELLESRVEVLENQLSKNSRNSSKPPSGDGFGKRTRSLRPKGERRKGGQTEHPGTTLEWSETVDWVVEHPVEQCRGCGACLVDEAVERVVIRQVHDLPPLELQVSEHRAEVKCCPVCGLNNQGSFPAEVGHPVQYGSVLKGVMVYLMEGQLLPSRRTVEVLDEVFGATVSEGTLYNIREQCFEALEPITTAIATALQQATVEHFDETGMCVNGKLWWLHVACTNGLTYYFVHPKRGKAAIDEMNILPQFQGKAVHDSWLSYGNYQECQHYLCNAHHLRELTFIFERYQQPWAFQMLLLLGTIKQQVDIAKSTGQTTLAPELIVEFEHRYRAVLEQGFAANPPPPPPLVKSRGRIKQSPPRNLLHRLNHPTAVLGFMHDFTVPFDNNQAERDLRMMKLKQKISGGFRSVEGANQFCRIRGYLSTLRKQGIPVLDALVSLFMGSPVFPELKTE
ncbi:MAG TPA: IS66 family transposase [Coleofasciculaceae cyanobacterium]